MTPVDRRRFLLVLPAGALGLACGEDKPVCKEPAPGTLKSDEKEIRNGVGYKHLGADPKRLCGECVYFASGKDCGSCQIMPGPTSPGGTCNLFREKG